MDYNDNSSCCTRIFHSFKIYNTEDLENKSQMICGEESEEFRPSSTPNATMIVTLNNNNNYITTSSIVDKNEYRDSYRWSSEIIPELKINKSSLCSHLKSKYLILVLLLTLIFTPLLVLILFKTNFSPQIENNVNRSYNMSQNKNNTGNNHSKIAWEMLKKNSGEEIFHTSGDEVEMIPCGQSANTPCCTEHKFKQLVQIPGCESRKIVNVSCRGGCKQVFIKGLQYVSKPSCEPVKTKIKKIRLNCDGRTKSVEVRIVQKCSCAEKK